MLRCRRRCLAPRWRPLQRLPLEAAEPEPPKPPFCRCARHRTGSAFSPSTMKRTIAKGDLATVRVGKHSKVPASYLAAYAAKDVLLPDQVVSIPTALEDLCELPQPCGAIARPLRTT
jgi:hypothetical protein